MIHIRCGKGKKDRYILVSGIVVQALLRYWKVYKTREWLFEGEERGKSYSIWSVEELRLQGWHCGECFDSQRTACFCNTHVGHESIQTTEIYTHVSQRKVARLQGPIEQFMKPEWK